MAFMKRIKTMADRKECVCMAWNSTECGCDADWTPQEMIDLREQLAAANAKIAEMEAGMQWRDISTAPGNEEILVCYLTRSNKRRIAKALRIDKFSMRCDDWSWETEDSDSDETTGEEYVPAGWYESIESNASDYGYFGIRENFIGWLPLPTPPAQEASDEA